VDGEHAVAPATGVRPSVHAPSSTVHAPQGEQQATGWGQGLGEQAAAALSVELASQAPAWMLHAPVVVLQHVTGHGSVLQARDSSSAGHAAPPLAAAVTMLRVRTWVPPPQGSEQGPQADQSLTTQSTGHGSVLQERDSLSTGQAAPPLAAATTMLRVRIWVPPPQGSEQGPQSDQSETTQLTGHGVGEQDVPRPWNVPTHASADVSTQPDPAAAERQHAPRQGWAVQVDPAIGFEPIGQD
jgi:hypothetical protein